MLGLARGIVTEATALREGGPWQSTVGADLHGRRLGLLGLGKIGSRVAAVGRAFGMDVVAWSQNLTPERAEEAGAELRRAPRRSCWRPATSSPSTWCSSERTRGLLGAKRARADEADGLPGQHLAGGDRRPGRAARRAAPGHDRGRRRRRVRRRAAARRPPDARRARASWPPRTWAMSPRPTTQRTTGTRSRTSAPTSTASPSAGSAEVAPPRSPSRGRVHRRSHAGRSSLYARGTSALRTGRASREPARRRDGGRHGPDSGRDGRSPRRPPWSALAGGRRVLPARPPPRHSRAVLGPHGHGPRSLRVARPARDKRQLARRRRPVQPLLGADRADPAYSRDAASGEVACDPAVRRLPPARPRRSGSTPARRVPPATATARSTTSPGTTDNSERPGPRRRRQGPERLGPARHAGQRLGVVLGPLRRGGLRRVPHLPRRRLGRAGARLRRHGAPPQPPHVRHRRPRPPAGPERAGARAAEIPATDRTGAVRSCHSKGAK